MARKLLFTKDGLPLPTATPESGCNPAAGDRGALPPRQEQTGIKMPKKGSK